MENLEQLDLEQILEKYFPHITLHASDESVKLIYKKKKNGKLKNKELILNKDLSMKILSATNTSDVLMYILEGIQNHPVLVQKSQIPLMIDSICYDSKAGVIKKEFLEQLCADININFDSDILHLSDSGLVLECKKLEIPHRLIKEKRLKSLITVYKQTPNILNNLEHVLATLGECNGHLIRKSKDRTTPLLKQEMRETYLRLKRELEPKINYFLQTYDESEQDKRLRSLLGKMSAWSKAKELKSKMISAFDAKTHYYHYTTEWTTPLFTIQGDVKGDRRNIYITYKTAVKELLDEVWALRLSIDNLRAACFQTGLILDNKALKTAIIEDSIEQFREHKSSTVEAIKKEATETLDKVLNYAVFVQPQRSTLEISGRLIPLTSSVEVINSEILSALREITKKDMEYTLDSIRYEENKPLLKEAKLQNPVCSTIAKLISEVDSKGITTYAAILVGNKVEYCQSKYYGLLKESHSSKDIMNIIDEMIEIEILDEESKRASFGQYTAIVIHPSVKIRIEAAGMGITEKELLNIREKERQKLLEQKEKEKLEQMQARELAKQADEQKKLEKFNGMPLEQFLVELADNAAMIQRNWSTIEKSLEPLSDKEKVVLRFKIATEESAIKKAVLKCLMDATS